VYANFTLCFSFWRTSPPPTLSTGALSLHPTGGLPPHRPPGWPPPREPHSLKIPGYAYRVGGDNTTFITLTRFKSRFYEYFLSRRKAAVFLRKVYVLIAVNGRGLRSMFAVSCCSLWLQSRREPRPGPHNCEMC